MCTPLSCVRLQLWTVAPEMALFMSTVGTQMPRVVMWPPAISSSNCGAH